MDWVFSLLKTPFPAAENLKSAKEQNRGTTFTPQSLQTLVDFSKAIQKGVGRGQQNDVKSGFNRVLEKATKAASANVNFALTAAEVKIWFQFFVRIENSAREMATQLFGDVDVVDMETANKIFGDFGIVDMFVIEPKDGLKVQTPPNTRPSYARDSMADTPQNLAAENRYSKKDTAQIVESFREILTKLGANNKAKLDMWLDSGEATFLWDLYQNTKDENTAVDRKKDPTHPQITAMEKISYAVLSRNTVKVHLDSEEVCCLAKLLCNCATARLDPNNHKNKNGQPKPSVSSGKVKEVEPSSATTELRADMSQNKNSQPKPSASNGEDKKGQPKTADSKTRTSAIAIDDKLKAMIIKYLPSIVPGVLEGKQPLISRWVNYIEMAFLNLTEHDMKIQAELDQLRNMMLDDEQEYEEQLQDERDAYAQLEAETQDKLAKLESELQVASDQLSKRASDEEKKYEEQLQIERDHYSKLKKETEEKIIKLESASQAVNNKIEKEKKAAMKREAQWSSKLETCNKEVLAWKNKFNAEIASHNVLRLDYDATLQELAVLKAQSTRIAGREAKCAALENELAALRSNRTNAQVERDNIAKAVRHATAEKKLELDNLQADMAKMRAKLHETQAALDKQFQQSDQHESAMKENEDRITLLKHSLVVLEEIHRKTKSDLEEANRCSSPDPKIIRELDEERMESKHLKDKLNDAATVLQEMALRLRN